MFTALDQAAADPRAILSQDPRVYLYMRVTLSRNLRSDKEAHVTGEKIQSRSSRI